MRHWHTGAVDKVAGELQQIIRHRTGAKHRCPADAKSFAKSHYQQFWFYLLQRLTLTAAHEMQDIDRLLEMLHGNG